MEMLQLGDHGPEVSKIRELLVRLGLLPDPGSSVEPHDRFDHECERAVREFQEQRGLVIDGLVGPSTLAALHRAVTRESDRRGPAEATSPADRTRPHTPISDLKAMAGVATDDGDDVEVTVFAPPSAVPGNDFLVQALLHAPDEDDLAHALALEADHEATRRGHSALSLPLPDRAPLTLTLSMPGMEIDDPAPELIWKEGKAAAVQFGVDVPIDFPSNSVRGTVTVFWAGIPIGTVKWKQSVTQTPTNSSVVPVDGVAHRYRRAFISYESTDRDRVLHRVQMLRLITDMKYFQDVLVLKPGERWQNRLYEEIPQCDLFLIFWSQAAKDSEWVKKEAEEALRVADDDTVENAPVIIPVIIEKPVPAPWPELSHLHFYDDLVAHMES
ncbi:TIR domain-containing protein [Gordonia phosphorivorans]|uniref:TIR domain-containing protein n=1 Tax=Gordonia phosphorivorans TaxID=1056982 RepID=A0ABV6HAZ2_9ACTN